MIRLFALNKTFTSSPSPQKFLLYRFPYKLQPLDHAPWFVYWGAIPLYPWSLVFHASRERVCIEVILTTILIAQRLTLLQAQRSCA